MQLWSEVARNVGVGPDYFEYVKMGIALTCDHGTAKFFQMRQLFCISASVGP